jgi:acyl dehydratase
LRLRISSEPEEALGITLDELMSIRVEGSRFSYGDRESMLYALGVGMGRDPLDENELPFVFEGDSGPKTIATMATVLTQFSALRTSGIDYTKVLHAEQRLTLHRPLPPAAQIIADYGVVAVVDKGSNKGILVYTETRVRDAEDGQPLFTAGGTIMARGDGGIGSSGRTPPVPHPAPDRAPDHIALLQTRPDQALLYRLNGDRNPLHSSPARARKAGFDRPILHGLCTYGITCRAVLAAICGFDHTRIGRFDVRFSSPVFPGEMLATDLWVDRDTICFRCRVPERNIIAIDNGLCTLLSPRAHDRSTPGSRS